MREIGHPGPGSGDLVRQIPERHADEYQLAPE